MDFKILEKANKLNKQIENLNEALGCFEFTYILGEEEKVQSANPRLIIEYDGTDGREQLPVDMSLNNELTKLLQSYISTALKEKIKEFKRL